MARYLSDLRDFIFLNLVVYYVSTTNCTTLYENKTKPKGKPHKILRYLVVEA
jgi:hypothetical protein